MLRYASHCLTACSVSLTQAVFGCFTSFLYISLLYLVRYSFSANYKIEKLFLLCFLFTLNDLQD
ncbi:MAG: hypothetical protein NZ455_03315 [Bacteroidia bacterium]|nr:hypothetical protein [Bacteroidia bacterium]MDW8346355.1 hypothetical protein [Bacteroidia bacterium]